MAIGARCMKFGMETDTYGVPNITSKSTFASMTMQKFKVVDELNVDRICTSVMCSSQRLASSSSSNKSKKQQ